MSQPSYSNQGISSPWANRATATKGFHHHALSYSNQGISSPWASRATATKAFHHHEPAELQQPRDFITMSWATATKGFHHHEPSYSNQGISSPWANRATATKGFHHHELTELQQPRHFITMRWATATKAFHHHEPSYSNQGISSPCAELQQPRHFITMSLSTATKGFHHHEPSYSNQDISSPCAELQQPRDFITSCFHILCFGPLSYYHPGTEPIRSSTIDLIQTLVNWISYVSLRKSQTKNKKTEHFLSLPGFPIASVNYWTNQKSRNDSTLIITSIHKMLWYEGNWSWLGSFQAAPVKIFCYGLHSLLKKLDQFWQSPLWELRFWL